MTGVSMLSVNSVLEKYGFQGGSVANNTAVIRSLPRPIQREFGAIEGGVAIDTPEEFLTATYFSPIEIQCAQARIRIQEVLPQDNPSVAGARLGAMWYQKLVAYQFATGDTPESREQIGRYELIMNTISERTGATRAEMVATFRAGVREIVAEKVEREFNKISFVLNGGGKTFNCVLTRNTDNEYTISYEGTGTGGQHRELTATSLDALLAQMGRSSDFNQATIAVVRDRAGVMPGVVFDNWVRLSDGNVDNIPLIVDMITDFYLNPNEDNFMLLAQVVGRTIRLNQTAPEFYTAFGSSFISSVAHLSRDLSGRINRTLQDRGPTYLANLSMPPRYSTLWTPYGVGGGFE